MLAMFKPKEKETGDTFKDTDVRSQTVGGGRIGQCCSTAMMRLIEN